MPAEIFPEYILIRVNESKCKKKKFPSGPEGNF